MLKFQFDISGIVNKFSLSKEDVRSLSNLILDRLVDEYMFNWENIVDSTLDSTRDEYKKGMYSDRPDDMNAFIGLTSTQSKLAMMIEAGATGQVDVNGSIAIGGQAYTTKNLQSVFGEINVIEFISRGVHINTRKTTAKDATATLTAAECLAGVITSTSAAAVALTLPSAADLIAVLNGGGQGTTFELIIDNSAGANSVTITPSATIAAITSPFTVTNPMIVTTAQKVGCFKFYFTSATSAIVSRVW